MKNDNISNFSESQMKLITGVNKIVDILKPTYGPSGSNIVIEEFQLPYHRVANDGKLITEAIHLSDPIEEIGANILREVCEKQEKEAGDGRKTTCILTAAILNEGMKYRDKIEPLKLKRELDECLAIIIKNIDEQKKEIKVEDIGSIASVAAEDKYIGKVISDIYAIIGREGIIEIDPSSISDTFYEIVDGVRIRQGWLGGYWQTEEGKCTVSKPHILISKDKIVAISQLEPLYKELAANDINELVIYCEDIDPAVASRLALTTVKGGLKTLIIKAPILWKNWVYEDLPLLTGATAIDSFVGKTFKSLTIADLGACDKIIVTKDETRLIGTKDIIDHIALLKEKGLKDDQQLVRASWLNTKVAVLKVGANSESELSWKIKKAKDACHASFYALADGVVTGAGKSLLGTELPKTFGGLIMEKACATPFNVLALKNDTADLNGVQDPAIVIKSAITNAVSVAGIILTASGVITIPPEVKEMIRKMSQQQPR